MNTPETLNTESKNLFNLISKNWEELDDSLKTKLIKIWNVLTYKWQLQILFNLPFLIWWALDKSFPKVHEFDATILNYLNLPDWALSFIGFGQQTTKSYNLFHNTSLVMNKAVNNKSKILYQLQKNELVLVPGYH